MAADAKNFSHHVHRRFNMLWQITHIGSDFPKPDLLHTIEITMLDHLQKWIFHFMKTHELLDNYNAIWLPVPAYHDLIPNIKSYNEVSQWNGKEINQMSRYMHGVVTQSQRGGSPA